MVGAGAANIAAVNMPIECRIGIAVHGLKNGLAALAIQLKRDIHLGVSVRIDEIHDCARTAIDLRAMAIVTHGRQHTIGGIVPAIIKFLRRR